MKNISINISNTKVGDLFYEKEKNQYSFNYLDDKYPISLIMGRGI